jgi:uncharacterized protein (TIGR02145 family)
MKNKYLPLIAILFSVNLIAQTHFTPVWSGTPLSPMALYISQALIDGENLIIGDEIGVFDGDICVGSLQLDSEITDTELITMSFDNPNTPGVVEGFTAGNPISIRYWNESEQLELVNINIIVENGSDVFTPLGFLMAHLEANTVYGCTDPEALNFNPEATIDDSSCVETISGCMDDTACNYNPDANSDNGSCLYLDCTGECGGGALIDECGICCSGSTGVECSYWNDEYDFGGGFNCSGTCYDGCYYDDCGDCYCYWFEFDENYAMDCDGVCEGTALENECGCVEGFTGLNADWCYGCTNEFAINYDDFAFIDNGSCEYSTLGDVNFDGEVSIFDLVIIVEWILTDDIYVQSADLNTDGFMNIIDVVIIVEWILYPYLVGCTDPEAENFDPEAFYDNGSCIIFGCTDPMAYNFDPIAAGDDGSCAYCQDFDGNFYETIQIGGQLWMAENLKTNHYNNGDVIPNDSSSWDGAYVVYDNDYANADIYGYLYNWYAVDDDRGVCPEGFHVPTDEEWMELESYLGMPESELYNPGYRGTDQGSQLAGNANLWNFGELMDNFAFGTSGFNSLPGGSAGWQTFLGLGNTGGFWSSSEHDNSSGFTRSIYYSHTKIHRGPRVKSDNISVRCVWVDQPLTDCTDASACNYNLDAIEDDGSCLYMDCNNDCGGTAYENECGCVEGNTGLEEDFCYGCTDPEALNYDPNAIINDNSCADTCTDYDGNTYETIQIGDQLWMAENLKVTHYNNGDDIPTGFTNDEWSNLDDTETGAFALYNDDPATGEIYGNIYNWYAVDDSRGVCPEDWHAPTDEEWMELEMYLGMSYEEAHDTGYRGTDQGSQLAGNADLWYSGDLENDPTFDSSGFIAIPGGYRNMADGTYAGMGSYGSFWSSSENTSTTAWPRSLNYYTSTVHRDHIVKRFGNSIRCLWD